MAKQEQINAADPRQVEALRNVERRDERAKLRAWRVVLSSAEGRLLFWELLEHCSVFASVYDSSSKIYANAARQDVGHYIMSRIGLADESKLFQMMKEASDYKELLRKEREAGRLQAKRETDTDE